MTPPTWRFDIAIEEDLIEEIARTHGFDRIPETVQPARQPMPAVTETRVARRRRGRHAGAARLLRGDHLQLHRAAPAGAVRARRGEPDAEQSDLGRARDHARFAVAGPRGGAGVEPAPAAAARAPVRGRAQVRRRRDGQGALQEVPVVAGIAAGPALPEQWGAPQTAVDFFDVRADVEALLRATGAVDEFRFVPGQHPALHPGQTAEIRRGETHAGWIGRLHPGRGAAARVDIFRASCSSSNSTSRWPPRCRISTKSRAFPAVRRDLAVVVDEARAGAETARLRPERGGAVSARHHGVRHLPRRGHRNWSQECGDRLEFTGRFAHAY